MTIKSMFLSVILAASVTGVAFAGQCGANLQAMVEKTAAEVAALLKELPNKEHAVEVARHAVALQKTIAKAVSKNEQQVGLVAMLKKSLEREFCRLSDMVDSGKYTWLEMESLKKDIADIKLGLHQQRVAQKAVELTGIQKIMQRKADLDYIQKPASVEAFLQHNWNKHGESIMYTAVAAGAAWVTYRLYQAYMNRKAEQKVAGVGAPTK